MMRALPERIEDVTRLEEAFAQGEGVCQGWILGIQLETYGDLGSEPGSLPGPTREDVGAGLADELRECVDPLSDLVLEED